MQFLFKSWLPGPAGGEAVREAPGTEQAVAVCVSKRCWQQVLASRRDSSPLLPGGCQDVITLREAYGCLCRSCPEVP